MVGPHCRPTDSLCPVGTGATKTRWLVYSLEVGKTVHWELGLSTLPFGAILLHPLKGTE